MASREYIRTRNHPITCLDRQIIVTCLDDGEAVPIGNWIY
jgi:hypothetical protein